MPSNYFWIKFHLCVFSFVLSVFADIRFGSNVLLLPPARPLLLPWPPSHVKKRKRQSTNHLQTPLLLGELVLAGWHEIMKTEHSCAFSFMLLHYQTQIYRLKSVRATGFTGNTCQDPRLSKALACFQLYLLFPHFYFALSSLSPA